MTEENPKRHNRKLSADSGDSADSESSDRSIEQPPSFTENDQNDSRATERAEVLNKHEYTIPEELGHGNSGRVFLVKSPDEESLVVKEINYRDNVNFNLDAVKNEINILKNLQHGYIAGYVESFEESGYFYIVSEYCAGGDLYRKMKTKTQRGFFEEEQILDWFVQICLALQFLHENNILHRDIKPQNVFLTEDGYINLGDFGCSKILQSDIWSLGWLLHDLCMLDVWANNMQRHILHAVSMTGTPPPISERYSEELRELIREMLSCDPKDRPSAEEILAKPFLTDAVKRNKRIPEALEQRLMMSINAFNRAYDNHYKDFGVLVSEWGNIIDSMESAHYSATAGGLSGAVIGAAGGITALVGLILAPFTFGASLIVGGVGVAVGVAGGVTGAASSITDTVQQKSFRESLEQIQQKYESISEPIFTPLNTLRRVLRKMTKFRDFFGNSAVDNVRMACNVGKRNFLCGTQLIHLGLLANIGRIVTQTARVGRVAAEAVSGVLSGLIVIADVAFIAMDSVDIHQMRQGKVDDPEKVNSSVLKSIAQMRKTHNELCNVQKEIEKTREELKNI